MTSTPGVVDPRPRLGFALDQLERQRDAVEPGDLITPTPCGDYDVKTLLAHVVAVIRKLATVGRGADMSSVADPAEDLVGRGDTEFQMARADFDAIWAADRMLDQTHAVAWGTMTGRELLDAYTHEFTVHSWDLAHATGRVPDLDPALAEAALAWFVDNVPPEDRSKGGPFGPVVEVDDDADIHTRLAGFVGRSVP